MHTKQLGNSDLKITPIGVGAWAMGGSGWAFAWGPQDDDDSIAAIHAALDKGVNWIDTAAVYGLGHSEEVVGRAVKGLANPPYIFTKCERIWDENRQIHKSLKADSLRSRRRSAAENGHYEREKGKEPSGSEDEISHTARATQRPCQPWSWTLT
jgi:aryl-alcohol dehydrogenase-like predicted oxidoreductase